MSKRSSSQVSRRTWNLLRVAVLWTKKGSLFRNKLVLSLNELGKGLRNLRNSDNQHGALMYGDREFSFDKTPIIHVKMNSLRFKMPKIPCIRPNIDFDYDFEFEDDGDKACFYESNLLNGGDDEDEGIDLKADEFIAKFYEQLRMQRQISYLDHNDMLDGVAT